MTLPEALAKRIAPALVRRRFYVPVVRQRMDDENGSLATDFLYVPAPDELGSPRGLRYLPIFSSGETVAAAGLSAEQCINPQLDDLAEAIGSEVWVVIDPGSEPSARIRLADLLETMSLSK